MKRQLLLITLLILVVPLAFALDSANINITITASNSSTNCSQFKVCNSYSSCSSSSQFRSCHYENFTGVCNLDSGNFNENRACSSGSSSGGGGSSCSSYWTCQNITVGSACFYECNDTRCSRPSTRTVRSCPAPIVVPPPTVVVTPTVEEDITEPVFVPPAGDGGSVISVVNTTEEPPVIITENKYDDSKAWLKEQWDKVMNFFLEGKNQTYLSWALLILFGIFVFVLTRSIKKAQHKKTPVIVPVTKQEPSNPSPKGLDIAVQYCIKALDKGLTIDEALSNLHKKGWDHYYLDRISKELKRQGHI